MRLAAVAVLALSCTSCSFFQAAKAPTRKAEDLAAEWCAAYYANTKGLTADQALKDFCATAEALKPWLDMILAGEKSGVGRLGVVKECK